MANKEQVEEIDEKDKGLFAKFKTWLKSEEPQAKAEGEEKPEEEEAKAEGDEEKPEEKAEDTPEKEKEEEAKAEDDEDKEKEEMKAQIASLEKQLAEAEASASKAVDASKEETEKAALIFNAVSEHKFTYYEAKELAQKSLVDVKAACDSTIPNASGAGKTERPEESNIDNKYDAWMSLKSEGKHTEAQAYYNENRTEILKDK